jgi:tRNA threonylcarbamoyl adenosine modification protein (Sua5/YciO/YrdC/YwlC family)
MRCVEIDTWHIRPDRILELCARVRAGDLIAMPTDTTWAVVCDPFQTESAQRLAALRTWMAGGTEQAKAKGDRPMSLMCGDLATIGTYVLMEQPHFRLVRRILPGPYTVLLPASREVPRQLRSKRREVGIRMPDHPVVQALLAALEQPLLTTTARDDSGELLAASPDVQSALTGRVDTLVETDPIWPEPSTVIDCTDGPPRLVRAGRGEVDPAWEI